MPAELFDLTILGSGPGGPLVAMPLAFTALALQRKPLENRLSSCGSNRKTVKSLQ